MDCLKWLLLDELSNEAIGHTVLPPITPSRGLRIKWQDGQRFMVMAVEADAQPPIYSTKFELLNKFEWAGSLIVRKIDDKRSTDFNLA